MTASPAADVIDTVLGLDRFPDLKALREQRGKLKHLTQTSYEAALRPAEPRNFSYGMRAALAARMATLWKSGELAAHYRALLDGEDPVLSAIADPGTGPADADARLSAILAHVDLVTLAPKEATRANIEKLAAAGLDDRDIVTLAGLIAFVNYQVLVVAGLKMLRDN
ncbi:MULTISPECIES: CMD domain protein [unclassified Shinella]|uniref:CMD domain protein n=1 Tax=unclassified Shinella TaxID=2643062 RepID=UPI00225C9130|nr:MULTISPECIES: CMD domain protein [unclassified Shinella]MCO5139563.1 CMD domain protein [Shinella sp.]MDC7258438.1 CMD domain protein [Shinella sp. YE25]CAI0334774.1 CMD domain protein, Avi_7170 family [Rhizobiaceae bacterium]CAK7260199.1 CMD domain protein [Shinella sp. WSC3-e]